MAIRIIERKETTRTYPRLMKCPQDGTVLMALHDHERRAKMIILSGPDAGKLIETPNWEVLVDYEGSVTIHNTD